MKKVNFSTTLVGLGALALALSLNFIYASNDYGISDNSLSVQVLAQTNKSGGGSGSSGESGTSSGTGTTKDKVKTVTMDEQVKTTVTCDGINHVTIKQKGYIRSCDGDGSLDCKPGWFPTEPASNPVKSNCPGWPFCWN